MENTERKKKKKRREERKEGSMKKSFPKSSSKTPVAGGNGTKTAQNLTFSTLPGLAL